MTAPALDLFPAAVPGAGAGVRLDVPHLGPAVPEILRVVPKRQEDNPTCFECSIPGPLPGCPFCGEPNDDKEPRPTIVIFDDGTVWQCHGVCLARATGKRAERTAHDHDHLIPECSICGEPFRGGHYVDLTKSFWDAYGDDDHLYRPARPFPSPHWPHRLIMDSPRYVEPAHA